MGKTKTALVSETARIPGLKGGQRVKMVEAEPIAETPQGQGENAGGEAQETKKTKAPKVRSKKYQEAKAKVGIGNSYQIPEAIKLVKETSYSKFDGSVELHLVVKRAGISANVALPYSTGREKKIELASDETVKNLAAGKIDFDVLLATADMMPKLVPYARTLGPKGLMPNPKNGTIIKSAKDAEKFSGNTIALKTEKEAPLIHTRVGKVSQDEIELKENIEAILRALGGNKQVVKAYAKATMGPAVKLQI